MKPSKVRLGLETGLAALALILGVITIFWHDWIEALTGWDPDHHNGSTEWLIVGIFLIVGVGVSEVARRDWRKRLAAMQ